MGLILVSPCLYSRMSLIVMICSNWCLFFAGVLFFP
ncbi:hypothetical protein DAI22_07g210150 [Oryza sativa Japonica Group]|nr:hypothetical protein DAI22_07g210150 [Oryza sativa Japonica Group]